MIYTLLNLIASFIPDVPDPKGFIDLISIFVGSVIGTFLFSGTKKMSKINIAASVFSGVYGAEMGGYLMAHFLPGVEMVHPVLGAICISSLFPVIVRKMRNFFSGNSNDENNI